MTIGILFPDAVQNDARRLSACITGVADETGNLAHQVVSSVELQLLQQRWPVGEALGPLPEVQKGLGIGRPVFREAITILEMHGLLDVRRGPGGGLFVSAPSAEDVVGALLMYLALTGARQDCVHEFRLVVWRMIVEAACEAGVHDLASGAEPGPWGFAFDLAQLIDNSAMMTAARFAEMLVRTCDGGGAPAHDAALESALKARTLAGAFSRLETLAGATDHDAPIITLEAIERSLSWSKRKSAMALAARLTGEMNRDPDALEAEWETAERLGYTGAVVRQARRILQDFGIVRCQRGRKGALWGQPVNPSGVIRLVAPYLIANGVSACDNGDAAFFLASSAPGLAAKRASEGRPVPVKLLPPFAQSTDLIDLFHVENLLLDLSGNPILAIMVRSLGLANFLTDGTPLAPAVGAEITAFNRRILRAIESGDIKAAGALARSKARAMRRPEANLRRLA